jgi:mono/diheme cytochrome c family protein
MKQTGRVHRAVCAAGLALVFLGEAGCSLPDPPEKGGAVPPEYADTHMPEGWWSEQAIIEEGRRLYLGNQKADVNCAQCHGKTGKPVRGGARDFRNTAAMKEHSDSYLLWRISEGVPLSQMRGYKHRLSREDMWKIIAFIGTLGMKGMHYDPETKEWVPLS